MVKALWIAHVNVLNTEKLAAYAEAATPIIKSHGGIFLARGGTYEQLEGQDTQGTLWLSSLVLKQHMTVTIQVGIKQPLNWARAASNEA